MVCYTVKVWAIKNRVTSCCYVIFALVVVNLF